MFLDRMGHGALLGKSTVFDAHIGNFECNLYELASLEDGLLLEDMFHLDYLLMFGKVEPLPQLSIFVVELLDQSQQFRFAFGFQIF